jgi:hypothetical protein
MFDGYPTLTTPVGSTMFHQAFASIRVTSFGRGCEYHCTNGFSLAMAFSMAVPYGLIGCCVSSQDLIS